MKAAFLVISFLVLGVGIAHAQPLDKIETSVLSFEDGLATVQLSWNHDESASLYEVGCVSCLPNFSETTGEDALIMQNVTSIPNSTRAILYALSYDSQDQIISAQQLIVELKN